MILGDGFEAAARRIDDVANNRYKCTDVSGLRIRPINYKL